MGVKRIQSLNASDYLDDTYKVKPKIPCTTWVRNADVIFKILAFEESGRALKAGKANALAESERAANALAASESALKEWKKVYEPDKFLRDQVLR